jgi:hypothetical protein
MPPPQFNFQNNQDPQNTSNKQMVVKHAPESKQKQTNQPKKKQNKPVQTKNLTKQPNSFSPLSFVGCT